MKIFSSGFWIGKLRSASPPTVLTEQLLLAKWPAATALRWLLVGGESLHRRPNLDHPFSVANCYGPAECTVVSTSYHVPPGGSETPTIGRAIPRTSTLILDAHLQPVPAGEPGELCLAGDHVGRGYWGNPALTAQHFVRYTPADGGPAVRIYRTGDRARELPNGEIVFLGRLDDQVKIRGYRIEPGEVSAWLDKLPSINKSIVIARDSGRGLELVAYFVPEGSRRPSLSELRSLPVGESAGIHGAGAFCVAPGTADDRERQNRQGRAAGTGSHQYSGGCGREQR